MKSAVDLNATGAAIRAGYSPKVAAQQAYENLRKPEIAAAVAEGKRKQLTAADLSAARVLEELRRLSFSDLRALFDEHGNLRPVHTLSHEQAACIASLEVVKKNLTAGDGQTDAVIKLRAWDKIRALECSPNTSGCSSSASVSLAQSRSKSGFNERGNAWRRRPRGPK